MSFASAEGSTFALSQVSYPVLPYAQGYLITNLPASSSGLASGASSTVYTSPVLPAGVYHLDASISCNAVAGNTLSQLNITVANGATTLMQTFVNPADNTSIINQNGYCGVAFISNGTDPITVAVSCITSGSTWGVVGASASSSVITLVRVA